nr:MAG TPA: hypothetical protein [Caudoviricetes sp.]
MVFYSLIVAASLSFFISCSDILLYPCSVFNHSSLVLAAST